MQRHRIVLAVFLSFALSAQAQESPCGDYVRWLGAQFEDGVSDVVWAGSTIAVAAYDQGLILLDPSDPTDPTVVGSEPAIPASTVRVVGDLAYVTSAGGSFSIVDISDPANPQALATLPTLHHAYGVAVIGDYAYVEVSGRDGPVGIEQFDVSDPTQPQSLGLWEAEYSTALTWDVGFLYVGRNYHGLDVYETSDAASPVLVGSVDGFTPRSILVNGDIAYVGNWDEQEILVVDLSNRGSPEVLMSAAIIGSDPRGLYLDGGYLYVGAGDSGLELFELADPSNPVWVLSTRVPNSARSVLTVGNVGFVTDGYAGLQRFDLSALAVPEIQTVLPTLQSYGGNLAIELRGDHAYLLEHKVGLRVIDVSNPLTPAVIASAPTSDFNHDLTLYEDLAYVSNNVNGVAIVDISNPALPGIVSTVDTPGNPRGMAADEGHLFVADGFAGLQIMDVSDPALAAIVAAQVLDGDARDVALVDGLAYVATTAGLEIVDVSNPLAPETLGKYAPEDRGLNYLMVEDGVAYCSGFRRFYILDVSNPDLPVWISDFSTAKYNPIRTRLHEQHLLLGTEWGMMVVDVRDLAAPSIVTQGIGGRYANDAAAKDGYVLLAAGRDGLQVLPMNCSSSVSVLLSSPVHQLDDGSVRIRWRASDPEVGRYRLRARQGSERWEVAIHQIFADEFHAVDVVRSRSGRIEYSLEYRSGSEWEVMDQFLVELHAPMRTRIVSTAPNPFNPTTTIEFSVARTGPVRIRVFDARGTLIRVLHDERFDAGVHRARWNGLDDGGAGVASGSYVIQLESNGVVSSKKVLLLQ